MKMINLLAMLVSATQLIVLIVLSVVLLGLAVAAIALGVSIAKRKRNRETYIEQLKAAEDGSSAEDRANPEPPVEAEIVPECEIAAQPTEQSATVTEEETKAPAAVEEELAVVEEAFEEPASEAVPVAQSETEAAIEAEASRLVSAEEEDDDDEGDEEEEDEETATETASVVLNASQEVGARPYYSEILKATEMSPAMREKFALTGAECDEKRYYVRYTLGFEVRLSQADPETKERFVSFADEACSYQGLKIKKSFKQQRIYKGRETLALVFFKGKKVCVAFALNPEDYVNTKYRGQDMSDVKRFEKTPYLLKLSSARKLTYAIELLAAVAERFGLRRGQDYRGEYNLDPLGRDESFDKGLISMRVLGEVTSEPDGEKLVVSLFAKPDRLITVEQTVLTGSENGEEDRNEIFETVAVTAAEPVAAQESYEPEEERPSAENSAIGTIVSLAGEKSARQRKRLKPCGTNCEIISTGILNANFSSGDTITVRQLVEKGLVPPAVTYFKVLFGGEITKSFSVIANDFSNEAAAILAAGGTVRTTEE